MIYVGIDVAKHKHQVAIIDDEGEIYEDDLIIFNNRSGFEKLDNIICEIQTQTNQEAKLGLEDTGHYSASILRFLKGKNYQVYSYNPILVKEFSKVHTLRKTKTDKKDALVIAKLVMGDFEKRERKQDKVTEELKELTRYRSRLGKHQALLKTQYTRILETSFPELATYGQVRYSEYMIQLFKKYPSPKKIAMAHEKTLSKLLGVSSSRFQPDTLKQLAKESVGHYSTITEFELTQTIQQMELFEKQIKEVDKKIQEMMDTLDSPIVTIPGISYRLGSIIIAEIGNILNFRNPGQLLAFAGMEPSIYQSGNYQGTGKMVKRGSPQLRWAMYHASRLVSIYSPTFKKYYEKKLLEGKHYNVVLSHVAKKLIRVIFHLMKTGESYKEVNT